MKINRENLKNISRKKYLEYIKMFPVLQKEKTKEYSMIILTFITLILFAILAINPTLSTIAGLIKQLEDAKYADEQLSIKIESLRNLQTQFAAIGDDYNKITNALPNRPRAAYFIGQVRVLADTSNVSLGTINTSEVTINSKELNKDLQEFTFNFDVSGNYSNIESFLRSLSNFERIIEVSSLNITKGSVNESQVQVNIQGKGYFLQ